MNNREENKEDLLRQYLNPERIETAPKGFTSGAMTRIQKEPVHSVVSAKSRTRNPVPIVFVSVVLLLLVVAILIPGNKSDTIGVPVVNFIKNIRSILPDFNFSSIFRLIIPSVMTYVFIGILVLTVFDRALYAIFHREK